MKHPPHVLVTAGPTREYLDDVRFLGNGSSGRMGYAIADALRRRGWRVTLVSGPTDLRPPKGVRIIRVTSALEMRRASLCAFRTARAVVMAAAVGDYRPARRIAGKIKKRSRRISIPFVRNPDIIAEMGRRKGRRILVGFALESRDAVAYALDKLRRKNLDAVIVNAPATLGARSIDALVVGRNGMARALRSIAKEQLARRVARLVENLSNERPFLPI